MQHSTEEYLLNRNVAVFTARWLPSL